MNEFREFSKGMRRRINLFFTVIETYIKTITFPKTRYYFNIKYSA